MDRADDHLEAQVQADVTKEETRLDGEAGALGTAQHKPATESKLAETPADARPSWAAPSDTTNARTEIAEFVDDARPSGTEDSRLRTAELEATPRAGSGGTMTAVPATAMLVVEARPRRTFLHFTTDRVADEKLTKKGEKRFDEEAEFLGTSQRKPATELGQCQATRPMPEPKLQNLLVKLGPLGQGTPSPGQQYSKSFLGLDLAAPQQPHQQRQSLLAKPGLGAHCGALPWTGLLTRNSRRRDPERTTTRKCRRMR